VDQLKNHFYIAIARVEGVEPLGDYHLAALAERDSFGLSYATAWWSVKRDDSLLPLDGYEIVCEDNTTTTVLAEAGSRPLNPAIFKFLMNDFGLDAVQYGTDARLGSNTPITTRLAQKPKQSHITPKGLLEEPVAYSLIFDHPADTRAVVKAQRAEGSEHGIVYRNVGSAQLAAASLKTILAVTRGYPELQDIRESVRA